MFNFAPIVLRRLLGLAVLALSATSAHATYWNVFNIEGESSAAANIVTYATLSDMLGDTNRTGTFIPDPGGFGRNIVGAGSDGSSYWNVFNIEDESSAAANIVTYATLSDMLGDTNRTGTFIPDPGGFGRNIVGSGSDGSSYWNVFNIEGESSAAANIVTYATLSDMLSDINRTGTFIPDPGGFGSNIVGSGSDGSSYWNVFNIEGESSQSANIVTYATLSDMLADTNRSGTFIPNPGGFGSNIVGSGSDNTAGGGGTPVPEPGSLMLVSLGMACLGFRLRRKGAAPQRAG
jgi:PEP-CTERM motif